MSTTPEEPQDAAAVDGDVWANRRSTRRQRTLLSGKLVFNNRWGALDCTVRDLSDGGAKVQIGGWLNLPKEVELHLERGSKYKAEVVRFADTFMGLRFVEPQAQAA